MELEDQNEIKTLHREYMFWVNNRQWDDVVTCFTEDASVLLPKHGLFKGKSEITHTRPWPEDPDTLIKYQQLEKGGTR